MLKRRGASLTELLVALTLAAIVLGTATASLLRQQQSHARITSIRGSDAQLGGAMMVLAGQLALLDPRRGDITPGAAEDSALQIRLPVVTGLACTLETGSTTLALRGSASWPRAGDTLWWRTDTTWKSSEITASSQESSTCGTALRLQITTPDTITPNSPMRVTRQVRYAFYRSGDGTWQLGYREWNASLMSFAAPQPVAGPFLRQAGAYRSAFRYFDDTGAPLGAGGTPVPVDRIARIRIVAHSQVRVRSATQDSTRTDSLDVALQRARSP